MKKVFFIILVGIFMNNYSQQPKEIVQKIINTKDYLDDGIDNMLTYSYKKQLGNTIKNINKDFEDYETSINYETLLKKSASVSVTGISKEDSKKVREFYFIFKKEEENWKLDKIRLMPYAVFDYKRSLLKSIKLYVNNKHEVSKQNEQDIHYYLKNLRPKKEFTKQYLKTQKGHEFSELLDQYSLMKRTYVDIRDAAYILGYYNASKKQIKEFKKHLTFFFKSDLEQIEGLSKLTKDLEPFVKEKRVGKPLDILDDLEKDVSKFGVEDVDTIGFPLNNCQGCYELSFAAFGKTSHSGLLYIPKGQTLLNISKKSYVTIKKIKNTKNWYYFRF